MRWAIICIGHEIAHVALLGGDIAHELKQQIVLANGQILHKRYPVSGI